MFDLYSRNKQINNIIEKHAPMPDIKIVEREIQRFKASRRRQDMITGERYYDGKHDILRKKRTVIGASGKTEVINNIPNNRIIDNQYKKMVNQKTNYLLGQPISFRAKNKRYADLLKAICNKRFMRLAKNIGKDSLNEGLGWLYVYYDDNGNLMFKRFKACNIIPGWADEDHTRLDYAIRLYTVTAYEGENEVTVEKVEVYTPEGIYYYILDGQEVKPDEVPFSYYFYAQNGSTNLNWSRIPLIPFKYNSEEIPLINNVKSLQDALNTIISNFEDNMEEDARNTILVLVNYDGQNLEEFRHNLANYGVVKVKTVDGTAGDLKTLQVEVNSENYKAIIEIFKKAIIENAMGYDAKDDRLSGNPNQMNIQSMYSDIDLDANEMETEWQASFEELLWFIDCHFANTGAGDFEGEDVEVIFNRDILISESEVIENCGKSAGILSDETIVANHPWVDDPQKELERKKAEKEAAMAEYGNAFNPALPGQLTDPQKQNGGGTDGE